MRLAAHCMTCTFTTLHAPMPPLAFERLLVQVRKCTADTSHLRVNPSIAARELPLAGRALKKNVGCCWKRDRPPGRLTPTYPAMAKFASSTVAFFNSGLDPVQYTCGGTLYPSKKHKTAEKVDLRHGRASCASATLELATRNKETSFAAR